MLHLKTCYKLTIPNLKFYEKNSIIIQSFNIHSLNLHFWEILVNQNLLSSHILCLNETKIQKICTYQEIYNTILSNKFNILSCYNHTVWWNGFFVKHNFNKKFKCKIHCRNFQWKYTKSYVIAIYKPPKLQVSYFIYTLEPILQKTLTNCPIITIGDFKIDMLTNTL